MYFWAELDKTADCLFITFNALKNMLASHWKEKASNIHDIAWFFHWVIFNFASSRRVKAKSWLFFFFFCRYKMSNSLFRNMTLIWLIIWHTYFELFFFSEIWLFHAQEYHMNEMIIPDSLQVFSSGVVNMSRTLMSRLAGKSQTVWKETKLRTSIKLWKRRPGTCSEDFFQMSFVTILLLI